MDGNPITAEGIQNIIKKIKNLHVLVFNNTAVNSLDFGIFLLNLATSDIGDRGVSLIRTCLPHLNKLILFGNTVSLSEILLLINSMPNLEYLDLSTPYIYLFRKK